LIPTTIESGPASGSAVASRKPASRIHAQHSAAVYCAPPSVSISMFRLSSSPNTLRERSSSISAS
jgi:hypothetical protein